jgi:hypothetical protein
LIVTSEAVVVGLVPKVPVMPAGQFDVEKVTAELKPLAGVTVIVEVPLDPTVALAAVAFKVKFGTTLTENGMVVVVNKLPLEPFTTSE